MDAFGFALQKVVNETTISEQATERIYPVLRRAFDEGQPTRTVYKALQKVLLDDTWDWPKYNAHPNPDEPKGIMFVNMVWRIAHGFAQRERIDQSSPDVFPYLALSVPEPAHARRVCQENGGKVFRRDDPYWNENFPPCERLVCKCRVIPMTEGMCKRREAKN